MNIKHMKPGDIVNRKGVALFPTRILGRWIWLKSFKCVCEVTKVELDVTFKVIGKDL